MIGAACVTEMLVYGGGRVYARVTGIAATSLNWAILRTVLYTND